MENRVIDETPGKIASPTEQGTPAKIVFILLVFFDPFVVETTLNALMPLRHRLDVIVVENPSPYTHLVDRVIKKFIQRGLVSKHFRFDENIAQHAVRLILEKEIDLERHRYLFVSDSDVIPYGAGWLDEMLHAMGRNPDLFAMGADLDRSNLPISTFPDAPTWDSALRIDRGDYIEGMMGMLAICFRGKPLKEALAHFEAEKIVFIDSLLVEYCQKVRRQRWGITKFIKFRHLEWDTYSDLNHPYTKFKLSKTLAEHWWHQKSSPYSDVTHIMAPTPSEGPFRFWPEKSEIEQKNLRKWDLINLLVKLRLTFLFRLLPSLRQ